MTALLSGNEEHRNIVILPPGDVRDILKLSPESMLRLPKAVYGLVNAPTKWWDRLTRSLPNLDSHLVRWIRVLASSSDKTKSERCGQSSCGRLAERR